MIVINKYNDFYRRDVIKLGKVLHDNYNADFNFLDKIDYVYCAFVNNAVFGFIHFQILSDHVDLIDIVIDKNYQRHGIGTLLMQKMINYCNKDIFLEVSVNNIGALNFYKQFDFSKVGIRHNYYSDADAIVMRRCYYE